MTDPIKKLREDMLPILGRCSVERQHEVLAVLDAFAEEYEAVKMSHFIARPGGTFDGEDWLAEPSKVPSNREYEATEGEYTVEMETVIRRRAPKPGLLEAATRLVEVGARITIAEGQRERDFTAYTDALAALAAAIKRAGGGE